MSGTGSQDFRIDDVFVPDSCAVLFQQLLDATSGIAERFSTPLDREVNNTD